jgi:hypothetical protein
MMIKPTIALGPHVLALQSSAIQQHAIEVHEKMARG